MSHRVPGENVPGVGGEPYRTASSCRRGRRVGEHAGGPINGFVLGGLLGVIWIPCIGPMLSSVLALVATEQRVTAGVAYLLIYSVRFSIPMLLLAHASQAVRSRFRVMAGQ